MTIVKEGHVFIAVGALLAVGSALFFHPYPAIFFGVLTLYFAYFFRNPVRHVPDDPDALVSPADGTVQDITSVEYDDFVGGKANRITVFMSVFDVHVNRSPMDGEIKCQKYVCGAFRPAYKDAVGFDNEHHLLGLENDRLRITVTQIAGILARRIVSWVTLEDKLQKGQLYGLIRFGSCVEIVMPENVEILVKKGQKVTGGETIIGRIKD